MRCLTEAILLCEGLNKMSLPTDLYRVMLNLKVSAIFYYTSLGILSLYACFMLFSPSYGDDDSWLNRFCWILFLACVFLIACLLRIVMELQSVTAFNSSPYRLLGASISRKERKLIVKRLKQCRRISACLYDSRDSVSGN
jgi:hypothetical protein